jgi:hypothetical protein
MYLDKEVNVLNWLAVAISWGEPWQRTNMTKGKYEKFSSFCAISSVISLTVETNSRLLVSLKKEFRRGMHRGVLIESRLVKQNKYKSKKHLQDRMRIGNLIKSWVPQLSGLRHFYGMWVIAYAHFMYIIVELSKKWEDFSRISHREFYLIRCPQSRMSIWGEVHASNHNNNEM